MALFVALVAWNDTPPPHAHHSTPVQPPVLTRFAINRGADTVDASIEELLLTHTLVGDRPTHFRVSRRADFAGAEWVTYADLPEIRGWYDALGPACNASRTSHLVTLYFQVRVVIGNEMRIVAGQRTLVPATMESNVMRDEICAISPKPADNQTP